MKIVNPSENELNELFAQKVAGWMQLERLGKMVWYDPEGGHELQPPRFTTSVDETVRLLEKWRDSGKGPVCMATIHSAAMQRTGWLVQVRDSVLEDNKAKDVEVIHWSLPMAIVFSLLKAHGVEVEVSQ